MPLSLFFTLVVAQGAVDRTVRLVDKVGPDAVERAAVMVQVLQAARSGGGIDPQLMAAIEDAFRANKKSPAADVARDVLAANPALLRNPAVLGNLSKLAEQARPARTPAGPDAPDAPVPPAPPPAGPLPAPAGSPDPLSVTPGTPGGGIESPPAPGRELLGPQVFPARTDSGDAATAARRQQQFAAAVDWWTKNVGSLDKTPAFKGILEQFIKGARPGSGGDSPLGRLLDAAAGSGPGARGAAGWLARNLEGLSGDLGGLRGAALPSAPTGMALPSSGDASALGGPAGTVVGLLAVVAAGWWAWRTFARPRRPGWSRTGPAGPPVDAAAVTDRDSLVRAFDRLGVAALGRPAAHWHHRAVAAGLAARAPAHAAAAGELADLYELARYAPAGDPFPADRLPAARSALVTLTAGPA